MRHLPGFVPANLHVSRDRHHVASYAQWWSQEDFDAMPKNPEAQPRRFATSFDPILCGSTTSIVLPEAYLRPSARRSAKGSLLRVPVLHS
jgi:hypothetical protein